MSSLADRPTTDAASSPPPWPRFLLCGDAALTVELGEAVDRRISAKVVRLHRHLNARPLLGVRETLPAFRSLLVRYDPRETSPDALEQALGAIIAGLSDELLPARRWTLPVCYAPEFGFDLAEVAEHCGLPADEVVAAQADATYYVYMLGFLPGHPYMGDLPASLHMPRRKEPRTRVPQGSLAIATSYAIIYPLDCPGGWNVIGRTPVRMFDASAPEPALLAPGDEVRFEPITLAEYETLAASGRGARLEAGQ
jgi:inhibitor of KinA